MKITPANSNYLARQQFVAQLLTILGDTRLLWLPDAGDTTTSIDESLNSQTVTYDATIAAQLSKLGLGQAVNFDGSSDYGYVADADNLSFGDGSDDSPFSVIALAKVTDTATSRVFVAKYGNAADLREWEFRLSAGDALLFSLYDESTDVAPIRLSSSAITQGVWKLFGATYSAATGGATAANDVVLYQDGLAIASAATNQASYVAMENTANPVTIGAEGTVAAGANFFKGDMALVAVVAKALTASEMWAIYQLCIAYFNFLA